VQICTSRKSISSLWLEAAVLPVQQQGLKLLGAACTHFDLWASQVQSNALCAYVHAFAQ
jgi:hypothetical protein